MRAKTMINKGNDVTTLYGIKNCDTVKKARQWLEAQDINYQFHDFRNDGINAEQVSAWLQQLGLETLINKRSTTWKQLDEAVRSSLDDTSAIGVIVENPTLIKRPLLEHQQQLSVGFKPAQYAGIFSG